MSSFKDLPDEIMIQILNHRNLAVIDMARFRRVNKQFKRILEDFDHAWGGCYWLHWLHWLHWLWLFPESKHRLILFKRLPWLKDGLKSREYWMERLRGDYKIPREISVKFRYPESMYWMLVARMLKHCEIVLRQNVFGWWWEKRLLPAAALHDIKYLPPEFYDFSKWKMEELIRLQAPKGIYLKDILHEVNRDLEEEENNPGYMEEEDLIEAKRNLIRLQKRGYRYKTFKEPHNLNRRTRLVDNDPMWSSIHM
jgi:hypothetical protein